MGEAAGSMSISDACLHAREFVYDPLARSDA